MTTIDAFDIDQAMIDGVGKPYMGLAPFDTKDSPLFFGREDDARVMLANLKANRITIAYGPSGVGKSSLIRAGVVPRVVAQADQYEQQHGTLRFVIVVYDSWSTAHPTAGLAEAVVTALSDAARYDAPMATDRLSDALATWTSDLDVSLLIALDQFEEYFRYHPAASGEFASTLAEIVTRRGLRVNILLSIREDGLGDLDRFKGLIPRLFDNYLRIQHLDPDSARQAIERPLAHFGQLTGRSAAVEPELVDAVLDQVRVGRVALGDAARGLGGLTIPGPVEDRVETVFLQLVMSRLWDEEAAEGSEVIRLATLERLGGAESIARRHLATAMDGLEDRDQAVAAKLYRYLVTPSGAKVAYSANDISHFAEVDAEDAERTMRRLASPRLRVLRVVDGAGGVADQVQFEIYHDILGAPIIAWTELYVALQKRRRRVDNWVVRISVTCAIAVILLIVTSLVRDASNTVTIAFVVYGVVILIPVAIVGLTSYRAVAGKRIPWLYRQRTRLGISIGGLIAVILSIVIVLATDASSGTKTVWVVSGVMISIPIGLTGLTRRTRSSRPSWLRLAIAVLALLFSGLLMILAVFGAVDPTSPDLLVERNVSRGLQEDAYLFHVPDSDCPFGDLHSPAVACVDVSLSSSKVASLSVAIHGPACRVDVVYRGSAGGVSSGDSCFFLDIESDLGFVARVTPGEYRLEIQATSMDSEGHYEIRAWVF